MTTSLTAEQHRAMEGVAPFQLPDEAILPSGRKLAGTRARVYWLLRITAEEGIQHRVGEEIGPAGWVPGYYFQRAWSGGGSGDRRRRDLSEKFGIRIESMRFGGDSATVLYRWAGDPEASRFPEASRKTLPLAPDCPMGGFSVETGTPGSPATPAASARLRFWTSVGHPGDGAPGRVRLTGGFDEHPLAMGPLLVGHVVTGRLLAADALAAYDAALRNRWPRLRAWLDRRGEHVLWIPPEVAETINPLPMLVEILGKCGAEYMGEWQTNRQAGVA